MRLRFDNDLELLRDEVACAFPREADNFDRLVAEVVDYDDLNETHAGHLRPRRSSSAIIRDPLLVEMLFCPLMFYGSAREHDMDWGQFSIMFRSIFLEGLGRPHAGVRLILKHLVRKFRGLGGELKLRAGVEAARTSRTAASPASSSKTAKRSKPATRPLLRRLVRNDAALRRRPAGRHCPSGRASSRSAKRSPRSTSQPRDLGHDRTITFFNDQRQVRLGRSQRSCATSAAASSARPNNFEYDEPLDDRRSA